ncbi:metal cation symporter ZIP14-like [Macrobrachium rosenbergii]|uniref:metal cation symporter ZIP14-like n=1 Tax=Macrobrachium rosenbergii TaxID=79674 RepID=UPI0034D5271D
MRIANLSVLLSAALGPLFCLLGRASASSSSSSAPSGDTDQIPYWSEEWGQQPQDLTDFTTFLWYGFSSNKINFTHADFQSLVDCTTGKKECGPIDKKLPVSILTDCDKNKALSQVQCNAIELCTSSNNLPSVLGLSENLSVEDLQSLLPVYLYQSQRSKSCEKEEGSAARKKPTQTEVWGYGLLCVTVISGCSLLGVSVMPMMAHNFYQKCLTLLVGLAAGSLAASSLFHLLPQAFQLQSSDMGHHEYLYISLFVLLGIWLFFMIERIIKINLTHQSTKQEKKKYPVSPSDQAVLCENGREFQVPEQKPHLGNTKQESFQGGELVTPTSNGCGQQDIQLIYASQEQAIKASFGHSERPQKNHSHSHNIEFRQGQDSVIKTVAWMIIFGDGFHNFIDGVSIGAAFSESILTGISISLAVMCEELPHELGDFAVLLNAGMTVKQAVSYNFLSSTTCYIGFALGVFLGEFLQNTTCIFALAAGMFLYIALVDMVPEMNEVASKAAEDGTVRSALYVLLLQNVGIFLGIMVLFVLAFFQNEMIIM